MKQVQHINPDSLHASPAFSHAVRVPGGSDMVYVGGQNGTDPDGNIVGPGVGEQSRQAFENLRSCLEAADATLADVVKWTILCVEGVDMQEGFAAAAHLLPEDVAPPAITVAIVSGLAVPGALVEVEAVAVVPAAG
jgi:enamine deaminase RidA (YjgF/YER057c/UK114 family)